MSERRAGFFDYTRAELFKVLHRPYTYLFLAVMLAGEALLAALWASNVTSSNTITFTDGAGILVMGLSMGLYCAIVTGDMVFSDQFKNKTLKHEVSFGLPRGRIYLGKLLAACITAVCLCAVMIVFYLGLCRVLLPGDPESNLATLKLVGYCLLVALPLWLGAQALIIALFFLFKSSTLAAIAAVVVFLVLPQVWYLLANLASAFFWQVYGVMLTAPFEQMTGAFDWAFCGRALAIGAGWFVISTVVGLVGFQRREIN